MVRLQDSQQHSTNAPHHCTRGRKLANSNNHSGLHVHAHAHACAHAWKLWADTVLSPRSGKVPRLYSFPARPINQIAGLQAGCWAYVASLSPQEHHHHHRSARHVVIRRRKRRDHTHAISTRLCPSACPRPSSSVSDPAVNAASLLKIENHTVCPTVASVACFKHSIRSPSHLTS